MTRFLLLPVFVFAGLLAYGLAASPAARGDVGGVYSDVPVFVPQQVVTITVTAEDDDGTLRIESSLPSSDLTVISCTGLGPDQKAGECDGSGMDSVFDNGSDFVRIDTNTLDTDENSELLTVTLTLIATCTKLTAVTISGDQPGNFGPDDVTINCQPEEPSPTATPTASPTPTPTQTPSPTPTATPTNVPEATPTSQPPAAPVNTPVAEVSRIIVPPSTGSAGLR